LCLISDFLQGLISVDPISSCSNHALESASNFFGLTSALASWTLVPLPGFVFLDASRVDHSQNTNTSQYHSSSCVCLSFVKKKYISFMHKWGREALMKAGYINFNVPLSSNREASARTADTLVKVTSMCSTRKQLLESGLAPMLPPCSGRTQAGPQKVLWGLPLWEQDSIGRDESVVSATFQFKRRSGQTRKKLQ
jgi:hypothetical protein